jgi:predicted hydrocarbon binding protein
VRFAFPETIVEPIPKSGLYYPNKIGRVFIRAMDDVIGTNGLNNVLNVAHLGHLQGNSPPDNLNRAFDFADYSALNGALEEVYGPRGGRTLALRAGRAAFAQGLRHFGALAGAGDVAFKILPLKTKLKIGIQSIARIFTQVSDQNTWVEETATEYLYHMQPCPVCWGRQSDRPMCHAGAGLLQEGMHWVSGGHEFRTNETHCIGRGDTTCTLAVHKDPTS